MNAHNRVVTSNVSQCSELGDVLISLSYSTSLQRLSVVVLRARGLQLLTDAGMRSYRSWKSLAYRGLVEWCTVVIGMKI